MQGFELSVLTGSEVLVLAASGDSVFSFATKKLQALLKSPLGRALIHSCLSAQDLARESDAVLNGYSETELLSDGRRRETFIQVSDEYYHLLSIICSRVKFQPVSEG